MIPMLTIDNLLPRLHKCKQTGPGRWQACCPAHDDQTPSLSIARGGADKLLLKCHAGCEFEEIIASLNGATAVTDQTAVNSNGHQKKHIVTTYDYHNEVGELLIQKVRYEPKSFGIRRPLPEGGFIWNMGEVQPVLYRLPELLKTRPFDVVYIVEGEKDADRLHDLGLTATCNFDGASKAGQKPKWRPELYNQYFNGRIVYILADNDEAGQAHAEFIANSLHEEAQCVKVIHLPGLNIGEDVSDWLNHGNNQADLEKYCLKTIRWQPALATAVTISENGKGPEQTKNAIELDSVPTLPETVVINRVVGKDACPWLDSYIDFSRRMSPRGYDAFHEAIGLWLLSTVAARRLVVNFGTKKFFPNLYIALCAHTTLYAKSTTARVAQDVMQTAGLAYLLLPNDMTPQAFINELVPRLRQGYGEMSSEQQSREKLRLMFASQRGWFHEEFGTKIQAMMRDSGFMAEFRGLLRTFDDNPQNHEYITMTRRDSVTRPYLALLANMTPADVRPYAKPGSALWQDGFWARWAFITPPLNHPPQYGRFPAFKEDVPLELTEPLKRWHQALGIPEVNIEETINDDGDPTGKFSFTFDEIQPLSCTLGNGVLDAYYSYHDGLVLLASEQAEIGDTDLIGNYGRFAEKAMRIAMLLAGINNQNRIELPQWARAQSITELWRQNLHYLSEQVTTPAPSQESQIQEKIVGILRRNGPGTAADIGRNIRGLSGPEVDEICQRLLKSGELIVQEVTQRKTNRYALSTP